MKQMFWLSFSIIFYAYIGYILSLYVLAAFCRRSDRHCTPGTLPTVSLLISAYNEEKVIEDKLMNALSLNYPRELLEITVVSDGSTDRTEEIVGLYSDRGVKLLSCAGRLGKTACLNKAIHAATGELVVFSDANSQYDPDALRELVKHFTDEKMGYVTGYTRYTTSTGGETVLPIGMYTRMEKLTKTLESKISSCVGADGAIFAIRKSLYQPLDDSDINDFVIPLNIVRQGFRGVLEEKAFCAEKAAEGPKGEYRRQVRITNRTIRAVFANADLLNPLRHGFFAYALFSHKLLKLLTPYFLSALFVTNALLVQKGAFYLWVFIGQFLFYALAALGYAGIRGGMLERLVSLAETFVTTNLAIFVGWLLYFRGETIVTWSKAR